MLVQPMREELTRMGVLELRTAHEVDQVLAPGEGTTLVVVNSVCGCAAANARPAVALALQGEPLPDSSVTVFAGQDVEATARARVYLVGFKPSSPSIALLKDGELVFMLERHQIEGRQATEIARDIEGAFKRFCGVHRESGALAPEDEVSAPIEFTSAAQERIRAFMAEDEADELLVRVGVLSPSPVAPEYEMALIEPSDCQDDDERFESAGLAVVVASESAKILRGTTIHWVEALEGSGFRFDNPNVKPLGSEPLTGTLAERVQRVLDERINPSVATHGGEITLVDVRDSVVYLRMSGGCQGCGAASVTLTQGIRQALHEAVPEIVDIQDVTDHAAGTNPYYGSAH